MSVNASVPSPGARHYVLTCSLCGLQQDDDGLIADCPVDHPPALLRTDYVARQFHPRPGRDDLFRYAEWLPVTRTLAGAGRSVVYRSEGLAAALGLPELWIAFNGYWPERGASLETGTFKEFEAHAVLGRLPEWSPTLLVASSGNTGAAFAWACSHGQVPCVIVVPAKGMRRMSFRAQLDPCVKLVEIEDGDYPDAIKFVAALARISSFLPEGGVKNVGRRDGLATVLLAAFEKMGRLPSHYFQAVGSGTGAIAALEAARRIRAEVGGTALPRLMLCQNLPFTPIYDAWQTRLRSPDRGPDERFREAVRQVRADELTNWTPPYAVHGGVYDSLVESQGDVLVAGNAAVQEALSMFAELEGVDVEPAVGVAIACLRDAVDQGRLGPQSAVLLNVTGGGRQRRAADQELVEAAPQLRLSRSSLAGEEAVDKVATLAGVLGAPEP